MPSTNNASYQTTLPRWVWTGAGTCTCRRDTCRCLFYTPNLSGHRAIIIARALSEGDQLRQTAHSLASALAQDFTFSFTSYPFESWGFQDKAIQEGIAYSLLKLTMTTESQ